MDFDIDPRTVEAARVGRQRCAWVRPWVSAQISNWLTNAPSTWVLIDPSEWQEVDSLQTRLMLMDVYARLGFSIHAHEVHMADVVVTFRAMDDDVDERAVTVFVEAESEIDAMTNVAPAKSFLLSPDSPKLIDEGLYAFVGKIGTTDLRPSRAALLDKMKSHRRCDDCDELRRRLGHDGFGTYCPEYQRIIDEFHRLDRQEKTGKAD